MREREERERERRSSVSSTRRNCCRLAGLATPRPKCVSLSLSLPSLSDQAFALEAGGALLEHFGVAVQAVVERVRGVDLRDRARRVAR
jgi:hypothetical protein